MSRVVVYAYAYDYSAYAAYCDVSLRLSGYPHDFAPVHIYIVYPFYRNGQPEHVCDRFMHRASSRRSYHYGFVDRESRAYEYACVNAPFRRAERLAQSALSAFLFESNNGRAVHGSACRCRAYVYVCGRSALFYLEGDVLVFFGESGAYAFSRHYIARPRQHISFVGGCRDSVTVVHKTLDGFPYRGARNAQPVCDLLSGQSTGLVFFKQSEYGGFSIHFSPLQCLYFTPLQRAKSS